MRHPVKVKGLSSNLRGTAILNLFARKSIKERMDFRALLYLVLELGIVGFIVYLITTYIPMPDIFKTVIYVIVAIAMIVLCLNSFGLLDSGTHTRVLER